VPLLNTCLFAEVKDAASDIGLGAQTESLTLLNNTSTDFLTASDSITWNDAEWANYEL